MEGNMSIVLMYHALYRESDTSSIDKEDLPYAVSEAQFVAQMERLAEKSVGAFTGESQPDVVVTFDDGHKSNLDIAAPHLVRLKIPAYFFVTTDFIDQRKGFMSSRDLRELAQIPGMIVGSHGLSHRFFSDLTLEAAKAELVNSKTRLEQMTGVSCRSMSFPGGRYNKQVLAILGECGYLQWFGSDVGIIEPSGEFFSSTRVGTTPGDDMWSQSSMSPLNRVAIRHSTQLDEFDRMVSPDPAYYRTHQRRSRVKKVLQRTLGNRLYHGLYKSFSAG
jgi:peptidoglycan/xylan/chitin deacetylase (PgdA/CDA1 family)